MSDFLDEILLHKYSLIKKKKSYFETLKEKVSKEEFTRYGVFKKAISQPDTINLIAEIKKASPSQGVIRSKFDVMTIAKTYTNNGAAAISILTEDKYFLGKPGFLTQVSEHFSVPLLTKDFIIDEGQIYEAYVYGASAILLIVNILDDEKMKHLMDVATRLDLDCLIEVHDETELDRALSSGAEIIGVNNRNLHTFDVDIAVSENIIPKIPKDKVIVAESGLKTHEEIMKLKDLGANAVLIGETFLREDDMASKIKELMNGQS